MPKHHQRGAPALRPKGTRKQAGEHGVAIGSPKGKGGAPSKRVKISAKRLMFYLVGLLVLLILFLVMKMHGQLTTGDNKKQQGVRGSGPAAATSDNEGDTNEHDQLAKMLEGAGGGGGGKNEER